MKYTLLATSMIVGIEIFMVTNTQKEQEVQAPQKYADARLSMVELKQGIEVKIDFLLQEIKESHIIPTHKGLTQLLQSIKTVRAYGQDIGKEAKDNLRHIVKQLKAGGFKDPNLLESLERISRSSVVLPA